MATTHMVALPNWSHQWFGFWTEDGPEFKNCPSIYEWIAHETEVVDNVVGYLDSCEKLVVETGKPCIWCGTMVDTCLAYITDGIGYWPSILSHYVEEHGVQIPTEFLNTMKVREFVPFKLDENSWDEQKKVMAGLEFPDEHQRWIYNRE
jgi:hypothetical protein